MKSLSRWLLVALLGTVLIGGAISGAIAYRSSRIEVAELFDAKLAHSARVLHGLVDGGLDGRNPPAGAPLEIRLWAGQVSGHGQDLETPYGHGYETRLAFQAFDPSGRLLLRSDNAPLAPLAPLVRGFADSTVDGVRWRSFVLRASSDRWYVAGERADVRADLSGDIAGGILLPLLVELPITALLICVVIGVGRRALQRLTAEVQARAEDRLQPIDTRDVPQEVAGLVDAVNALLLELDAALARERRFAADAAHELRTPVAGLLVQLSNLRAAGSAGERAHAEAQLASGLERLQRLVAQLLVLTRLEPGATSAPAGPVDLAAVCREVIAEFADANGLEGVELSLTAVPATVVAERVALASLVRNLVDNALRYSGRPATVALDVSVHGTDCVLQLDDSGGGIPAAERGRVTERFYRALGTDTEGSGLGLSICHRIVEACGGSLVLEDAVPLGGLRVRVVLPRAAG